MTTTVNHQCGNPGILWRAAMLCPMAAHNLLSDKAFTLAWDLPPVFDQNFDEMTQKQMADIPEVLALNSFGAMIDSMHSSNKSYGGNLNLLNRAMASPNLGLAEKWITMYTRCIRTRQPVTATEYFCETIKDYFLDMSKRMRSSAFVKKLAKLLSTKVTTGFSEHGHWLLGTGRRHDVVRLSDASVVKRTHMPRIKITGPPKEDMRKKVECIQSFLLNFMLLGVSSFMAGVDREALAASFLPLMDWICKALHKNRNRGKIFGFVFEFILAIIVQHSQSPSWQTRIATYPNILKFLAHVAERSVYANFAEGSLIMFASMFVLETPIPESLLVTEFAGREPLPASHNNLVVERMFDLIGKQKIVHKETNAHDMNANVFMALVASSIMKHPDRFKIGVDNERTLSIILFFNNMLRTHFRNAPNVPSIGRACGEVVRIVQALSDNKTFLMKAVPGYFMGLAGAISNLIIIGVEIDEHLVNGGHMDPDLLIERWMMPITLCKEMFGDSVIHYCASQMKPSSRLKANTCFKAYREKIASATFRLGEDPITMDPIMEIGYLKGSDACFDAFTLINTVWLTNRNPMTNEPLRLVDLLAWNVECHATKNATACGEAQ